MSHYLELLNELSEKLGIWREFTDPDTHQIYKADTASKVAICHALGYNAETQLQVEKSLKKLVEDEYKEFAPFCLVMQPWQTKPLTVDIHVPACKEGTVSWTLSREDGTAQGGTVALSDSELVGQLQIKEVEFYKFRLRFDLEVPLGYHTLSFLFNAQKPETNSQTQLIMTPYECYFPDSLKEGKRVWGIPLQLYACASAHNWGMGDFSDLANFANTAKELGASVVGVNPLNALFLDDPGNPSPYQPSSRVFLHPLYIDTDAIAEAQTTQEYLQFKESPEFQEFLKISQQSNKVQYEQILPMKIKALEILFDAFCVLHFDEKKEPITPRGQAFLDFCHNFDGDLDKFATFQALRLWHKKQGKSHLWWRWEKEFHQPGSEEIQKFQKKQAHAIEFQKFMQFIAFEQYENVGKAFQSAQLEIGLYADLPVGTDVGSAEVWMHQELFLTGLTIGAPPDTFNKKGQDWALAPQNPLAMKKNAYQLWRTTLQGIMRSAGALRIDHAFGLMRLYLRLKDQTGAYLSYPFKDIMGILALESQRHKCIVITEDLGTPPPDFYEQIRPFNTLGFRLFRYQKWGDAFMPPESYEPRCLIASGTHDLPTFSAFWKGLDLILMRQLDLLTEAGFKKEKEKRYQERQQLVDLFKNQQFDLPEQISQEEWEGTVLPDWFIPLTYQFLGRSKSCLLLARLEDMLLQEEQINLPGTFLEYPNWRFKLAQILDNMLSDQRILRICEILNAERK